MGSTRTRRGRALASALLAHPGRWLLAALLLDLATYRYSIVDYGHEHGDAPWLVLDLFLFWRVWCGGTRARGVLVFLLLLTVALNAVLMLSSLVDDSVIGGTGWLAWLCAVGSLACLLAPALDPDERPFGPAADDEPVRVSR